MNRIFKEKAEKIVLAAILFILALIIGAGAFYFGYQKGLETPKTIVIENVSNINSGGEIDANFGIFWEAWDLIKREYFKGGKIVDKDLVYGAITGLVNSLGDPNTVFLPPEDSKKFEEDVNGNFGGIGAEIGIKEKQLVIIAPLKGNPAEKAGLKAGDKILAINEKNASGLDVSEAVKKIRGEIGTAVTLAILREGWEKPQDFKIIRDNIEIPTMEWSIIQKDDKKFIHLKLFSFNQNAPTVFYKAVLIVLYERPDGIILDLRNNPGGFLEVAINIAGWFLDRGDIVATEKFRNQEEVVFRASGNAALKNIPMVILVNKGSASASEILAGALRAQIKTKLVGETTFGKGTVQELRNLSDNSTVKLTVANWLLPDGTLIDEKGIKPDIEVELKDEDAEKGRDPQLDKAVEVILREIKVIAQ
ncbi:MAG: hypothetical protein A3I89_03165 [Candidatus Harrisonbacteria bacterium RIFCSPLOWO2_02_FULL_41_11]|uniref:PDZ domain-containing protein n=1 Tax=Candidatus Harrisonbacteria bacterium RIFCSPHIGHO2_02_FULL_42_16 TaxID=1798404 RepID=A0A1G1ZJV8_9BACT|nr:MAG: hypothetical protein A3B92_02655 [Candidatus Harrisonbacteria bacterium RIFCSPHIGHO2_02_FULL_42_16]OGY66238.1 MAG: hypothetical protein A3I89_03165 [Candidatus Harrisonbacteria bacterium RIFCSPLOWO2_02_FULL_41_11]